MSKPHTLDAHARPPSHIRNVFKTYQKALLEVDTLSHAFVSIQDEAPSALRTASARSAIDAFCNHNAKPLSQSAHVQPASTVEAYECSKIPGLFFFPNLLPSQAQLALLENIFERDLLDPVHQTNVHMHYNVQYPPQSERYSFFDLDKSSTFSAKDPSCHKPLTVAQFLEKKLRWMTLGGQYDWTHKMYPAETPPAFPEDIKDLIEGIFDTRAEAAIVNLYSPGDTLSLHRDVSETCNRPLISVSIGCECIFVIGLEDHGEDTGRVAVMRLRSGDAVVMSGDSRYAWHGVPKVLPDTCPEALRSWPAVRHPQWTNWMSRKRINLNIRQMFE